MVINEKNPKPIQLYFPLNAGL